MSASRPYYDSPEPPDPMLDVVYDSVLMMFERQAGFGRGLADVAGLVSRNLAGADGAGVALMDDGEVALRVASSKLVDAADAVQYGVAQGPCLSAVAERRIVRTGSFADQEEHWPRFAHGVRPLGIGSVMSLPLNVRGDIFGSINIYSLRTDAFSESDAASGERFARPVAAAIRSTQVSRHLDDLAGRMQETLQVQALVSAAVGFLSHRENVSTEAALELLSERAAEQRESLAEAASDVLADRNDNDDEGAP